MHSYLQISVFVGILTIQCPCKSSDYYVKPIAETSQCPSGDQQCKTLDEYAIKPQDFSDDVRMLFLAGQHYLSKNLIFSHLDTVQMIPATETVTKGKVHEIVSIQLLFSDSKIMYDSISTLILGNLIIIGSGGHNIEIKNTPAVNKELHIVGIILMQISLIYTYDTTLISTVNITIQNSFFGQSDLRITDKRIRGDFIVTVAGCNISNNNEGGIIIESSTTSHIYIRDSIIQNNRISSSGRGHSAAFSAHFQNFPRSSSVYISNTHFFRNQDLRGQLIDTVVYILGANASWIFDCVFQDNNGTALRVEATDSLYLQGTVSFINNRARKGGALAPGSAYIYFMPDADVTFENNYASRVGGAIYVESLSTMCEANNPNTHIDCFYQLLEVVNLPKITFINNSASLGGHHIFGASLMSYCYSTIHAYKRLRSSNQTVQSCFQIEGAKHSPISSEPSRVCVIDTNSHNRSFSDNCANTSQIFITKDVFPGEEFTIEAILTGAEFGTGTGAVHAQLLNASFSDRLHDHQHSQRIDQPNTPKTLTYSVFSTPEKKLVLVLTATDSVISVVGSINQIERDIQVYEDTRVIPINLLTTPVYIDMNLSKCPPGFFFLDPVSMGCRCNPKICNDQIIGTASNRTGLFSLRGKLWANSYNEDNVSGAILHYDCPFDYCNASIQRVDLLNHPDSQCGMGHAGVLCGKCKPGLSLALGSNKCLPCSNDNNLALLLFFAAAGFLLVFFIKFFNMTVSQGTVNGLIFYANIMWAYKSIVFASNTAPTASEAFFQTFIAWINLDFGIEVCFVQGLTAHAKTWLQFLFPLYIWSIAGGMILTARYSKRMTKIIGNNSVQVLATLILLSYAKLLRTIITVIVPATLYAYTDNGAFLSTKVVWAFDGNLDYGRVPHIFLIFVALLILIFLWVPYTFVLLFIQPLRNCSRNRILRWVSRGKPFFDAYVGPLNPPNYFWVGLLLLVRFILLLIFTLTYTSNVLASKLALIFVVLFLLTVLSYTDQLYDAPTKLNIPLFPKKVSFRSILEISYLLNLVVVGGSTLYGNGSTNANTTIVNVSIITAFAEFIGIFVYHLWCAIKVYGKPILNTCNGYQNLDRNITASPTTTIVDMGTSESSNAKGNYLTRSHNDCQFREPLLAETTA